MLRADDWFWNECKKVDFVGNDILTVDISHLGEIKKRIETNKFAHGKVIEVLHWSGYSPGPLLVWREGHQEKIGMGLWTQDEKATDHVPYFVLSRGHLFDAIQKHYQSILRKASPLFEST